MKKISQIKQELKKKEKVAIMYSGGVDSTLLAKLAHKTLEENTIAITIKSNITPEQELKKSEEIAEKIGIKQKIIQINELEKKHLKNNPSKRCYICRKTRDKKIKEEIGQKYNIIADGMNYTDLKDFRPGIKASNEDGIWHPFIEFKVTKEEIREYSKKLSLPTWNSPTTSCLCSRFPYNFSITKERIEKVKKAEEYLKGLGYKSVRVRHFPKNTAFIEISQPERIMKNKDEISQKLRELGFSYVAIDLEGYKTGKMNRTLENNTKNKYNPKN